MGREIQLTDWKTAGEQGKLIFVVSTKPSLVQFISRFTTRKKSCFDRPNHTSIQVFHFKISVKTKRRNQIRFDKQNFFFVTSIQFVACAFRENLSDRSIPRDIFTRFGRYLYSKKCSWLIIPFILTGHFLSIRRQELVQGESLSPILGLGVNPFTSRFLFRTTPLGDSVRPLLLNKSKRSYLSVKGTMLLFAGKSVHKNKVTRERVDSRNEWRWRLPSISSPPRVTKT